MWTLSLAFCADGIATAEDYAARYKQLRDEKAPAAQIDSVLDEWRAKQSDDPEAWVTSANYYFNESLGTMISTDPADKGQFRLKNKKSGKGAGGIVMKGDNAATRKWYEAVITAEPNGELATRAKEGLVKLKK